MSRKPFRRIALGVLSVESRLDPDVPKDDLKIAQIEAHLQAHLKKVAEALQRKFPDERITVKL